MHQVNLPGVHYASFHIVTGQGSSLLVNAGPGGYLAGASLVWFNPHTKKVASVVGTPKKVVGVKEPSRSYIGPSAQLARGEAGTGF